MKIKLLLKVVTLFILLTLSSKTYAQESLVYYSDFFKELEVCNPFRENCDSDVRYNLLSSSELRSIKDFRLINRDTIVICEIEDYKDTYVSYLCGFRKDLFGGERVNQIKLKIDDDEITLYSTITGEGRFFIFIPKEYLLSAKHLKSINNFFKFTKESINLKDLGYYSESEIKSGLDTLITHFQTASLWLELLKYCVFASFLFFIFLSLAGSFEKISNTKRLFLIIKEDESTRNKIVYTSLSILIIINFAFITGFLLLALSNRYGIYIFDKEIINEFTSTISDPSFIISILRGDKIIGLGIFISAFLIGILFLVLAYPNVVKVINKGIYKTTTKLTVDKEGVLLVVFILLGALMGLPQSESISFVTLIMLYMVTKYLLVMDRNTGNKYLSRLILIMFLSILVSNTLNRYTSFRLFKYRKEDSLDERFLDKKYVYIPRGFYAKDLDKIATFSTAVKSPLLINSYMVHHPNYSSIINKPLSEFHPEGSYIIINNNIYEYVKQIYVNPDLINFVEDNEPSQLIYVPSIKSNTENNIEVTLECLDYGSTKILLQHYSLRGEDVKSNKVGEIDLRGCSNADDIVVSNIQFKLTSPSYGGRFLFVNISDSTEISNIRIFDEVADYELKYIKYPTIYSSIKNLDEKDDTLNVYSAEVEEEMAFSRGELSFTDVSKAIKRVVNGGYAVTKYYLWTTDGPSVIKRETPNVID